MKIPHSEMARMEQLQQRINKLAEMERRTHYWNEFSKTIANIILGCSSKLTKCDAKIMLEKDIPSGYSYNTRFALTREGLKERFGSAWSDDPKTRLTKARSLVNSGTGWLTTILKEDKEDKDIVLQLKEIRSDKGVTIPEGIDRLVECITDLRKTGFNSRQSRQREEHVELELTHDVDLSLQPDPDGMIERYHPTPLRCIQVAMGKTGNSYYGEINAVLFGTSRKALDTNGFKLDFGDNIPFHDFVRVSEPEVFDEIMKITDEFMVRLEQKIADDTKSIREFIEKWGVYGIKQEL